MIRLVFTKIRETFTIEIEDKIIVYKDKKFPNGIQFLPKEPGFDKMVLFSRNKINPDIVKWINESNSGKNLEEYQEATNDEALVPIIIKDAKLNGAVFQGKREV